LRDGLHPGANQRYELSAEEKLEITVAQGSPRGLPIQFWRCRRFMICLFGILPERFRISHVDV
jgi:hypothetical protein